MDVMIAGGEDALLKTSFCDRLRAYGIDPKWMWPDPSYTNRAFPIKCEGVIVLKNWVGHRLGDHVSDEARQRNLPLARVTSKFSLALPILRDMGFVQIEPDVEIEPTLPSPQIMPDKLSEVTYAVLQMRKLDAPLPTLMELQQQVRQRLGAMTVLDEITYNRVLKMNKRQTKKQQKKVGQSLYDWAMLHLEERPELIVVPDLLQAAVTDGLSPLEQEAVKPDALEEAAGEAIVDYRAQLDAICEDAHRVATEGDKLWEMQVSWLLRVLPEYARQHDELGAKHRKAIQASSELIFGRKVFWKTVEAQFLRIRYPERYTAPPEDDMISVNEAHTYFLVLAQAFAVEHNQPARVFTRSSAWLYQMIHSDKIAGVKSGEGRNDKWMTTHEAVKTYIDGWLQKELKKQASTAKVGTEPEVPAEAPVEEAPLYSPVLLEILESLRQEIDGLKGDVADLKDQITDMVENDTLDGRLLVVEDSIQRHQESLNLVARLQDPAPASAPQKVTPLEGTLPDLYVLLEQGYKITISK